MFKKISHAILYLLYLAAIVVVFDVVVLRQMLGFGYPTHFEEENLRRYPAPYKMFAGQPNRRDHNEFGFRGPSLASFSERTFKIVFFGGSTGYNGQPPIASLVETILRKEISDTVRVANLSVTSSNHRQHLHSILEDAFLHRPDLIIFYGGNNETMLNGHWDPRPGYPYNYFYRTETGPLQKVLIRYSAIMGELDRRWNFLTNLDALREAEEPFSPEWNIRVVDKYFETLGIANSLASAIPSQRCGDGRFMAFYQPVRGAGNDPHPLYTMITERISSIPYAHDVSRAYDSLDDRIYRDSVHVNQEAKAVMARTIADILIAGMEKGMLEGCDLRRRPSVSDSD